MWYSNHVVLSPSQKHLISVGLCRHKNCTSLFGSRYSSGQSLISTFRISLNSTTNSYEMLTFKVNNWLLSTYLWVTPRCPGHISTCTHMAHCPRQRWWCWWGKPKVSQQPSAPAVYMRSSTPFLHSFVGCQADCYFASKAPLKLPGLLFNPVVGHLSCEHPPGFSASCFTCIYHLHSYSYKV